MFSELTEEYKIKLLVNHNLALMKRFDDLEKKHEELAVSSEATNTKYGKLAIENSKMQSKIIQIEAMLLEQVLNGGKKKRFDAMKRFLKQKELIEEFENYYAKLKGQN